MALELFIYTDQTLTAAIGSGKVVNTVLVMANSQADADAIIAQQVATSQFTNYPVLGGTVTKHRWLNSSFNKLAVLAKEDSGLSKGTGAQAIAPGVLYEWQFTVV